MGISLWQSKDAASKLPSLTESSLTQASIAKSEKVARDKVVEEKVHVHLDSPVKDTSASKLTEQKLTEQSPSFNRAFLPLELDTIHQSQLFSDVLSAFELSKGEISFTETSIEFDLFRWQFIEQTPLAITSSGNHLVTPKLAEIAHSSVLKKQLWQALQQKL